MAFVQVLHGHPGVAETFELFILGLSQDKKPAKSKRGHITSSAVHDVGIVEGNEMISAV